MKIRGGKNSNSYYSIKLYKGNSNTSGRKTLLQYSSLTLLERGCYDGEVQPYREGNDYKSIMYINIGDLERDER